MSAWREFWDEAARPSTAGETAYQWAVIQCGHVVLGMAAAALAGLAGEPAWAALAAAAYLAKEVRDLRRGGSLRDGLIDCGFFLAGTAFAVVPSAAPAALVALALGITLRRPRPPD